MKNFLITTSHLSDRIWFRDDADFKIGMVYVAVASLLTSVAVLSFVLMSNHVHFVVRCTDETEAKDIIEKYKSLYGRYLHYRYGESEMLRRVSVDIRELSGEEATEKAVAYTHMNPVAANICATPESYSWSSASSLFRTGGIRGSSIANMSCRARYKMFHTRTTLPDSLRIDNGMIVPESFVDTSYVERLFRKPSRYNFFLRTSSKARIKLEDDQHIPAFTDQVVGAAISNLCHSLFRKASVQLLNFEQKVELIRQLRFRFSSEIHQISRVCGFSPDEASILFNEI